MNKVAEGASGEVPGAQYNTWDRTNARAPCCADFFAGASIITLLIFYGNTVIRLAFRKEIVILSVVLTYWESVFAWLLRGDGDLFIYICILLSSRVSEFPRCKVVLKKNTQNSHFGIGEISVGVLFLRSDVIRRQPQANLDVTLLFLEPAVQQFRVIVLFSRSYYYSPSTHMQNNINLYVSLYDA